MKATWWTKMNRRIKKVVKLLVKWFLEAKFDWLVGIKWVRNKEKQLESFRNSLPSHSIRWPLLAVQCVAFAPSFVQLESERICVARLRILRALCTSSISITTASLAVRVYLLIRLRIFIDCIGVRIATASFSQEPESFVIQSAGRI